MTDVGKIRLIVTTERHSVTEYTYDHRFDLDSSREMVFLEGGVDANNIILEGRETHWRIEKRPSGLFYCSRFTVNRKDLVPKLLDELSGHIPPEQREIGVTIETKLPQEVDQNEIEFPFPSGLEPLTARSSEVGPASEIVFGKAYLASYPGHRLAKEFDKIRKEIGQGGLGIESDQAAAC